MWVIIVIIILLLLMILVLKMTKKYQITWYLCQNIRENMVEKRVKKIRAGVSPPPFRAMPERKKKFPKSVTTFWSLWFGFTSPSGCGVRPFELNWVECVPPCHKPPFSGWPDLSEAFICSCLTSLRSYTNTLHHRRYRDAALEWNWRECLRRFNWWWEVQRPVGIGVPRHLCIQ